MDYLNDPRTHHASAPPLSIDEISRRAMKIDYNPLIPLRYWMRTADTLLKEAAIYQAEGNEQQSYLLLLRVAELQLNLLPGHPDYGRPENIRIIRNGKHGLNEALKRLEYLKPRIRARYERYVAREKAREEARNEALAREEARRRYSSNTSSPTGIETPYSNAAAQSFSFGNSRRSNPPKSLDLGGRRGSVPSGPFSPPLEKALNSGGLNGSNKAELAFEIAKQEFERRETIKRQRRQQVAEERGRAPVDSSGREIRRISTPTNTSTDGSYPKRYSATVERYTTDSGYSSINDYNSYRRRETDEERARREREKEEEEFDLARSIEALHMRSELTARQMQPKAYAPRDSIRFSTANYDDWGPTFHDQDKREREKHVGNWQYNYPTIPKPRPSPAPAPSLSPMGPPPLPDYGYGGYEIRSVTPTPPPKPPSFYDGAQSTNPPALPSKVPNTPPPPAPEEAYQFETLAALENGDPLRTIFLPATLRNEFLRVAAPNTHKNLETCGILCGTLIQNAFFISRLVIPEQEATSDTCGTTDEEGLFTYCDNEQLMVLGWIHTHPTQTCFMSSVDLHTHCSYQLMLPESIAIVCAPKHEPSWGVFRLTDPPGVKTIMNCRNTGLFHPHGEDFVYTDAMRPGHVYQTDKLGFEVVDLRKDKR